MTKSENRDLTRRAVRRSYQRVDAADCQFAARQFERANARRAVRVGSWNAEIYRVGLRVGIRAEHRLPQTARAAVVRVGDGKCRGVRAGNRRNHQQGDDY